jgi:hypothetical protein
LTTQLYESHRHERRLRDAIDFAGSRTLVELERLAHHHRRGQPFPRDRPRPAGDGLEILHLALAADGEHVDLLFAEMPGELFTRFADNQVRPDEIPWLRRADKLALLADGMRLRDPASRSMVPTRIRQLLERVEAAGLGRVENSLALATSKWDLVVRDPGALSYWTPRERELLAEMRTLDPRARAFRLSGRAGREAADGLRALRGWLLGVSPAPLDSPLEPYEWPADAPPRLLVPLRR